MQPELKNIFVSLEVAKLAKEKGFDEPCYVVINTKYIGGDVIDNQNLFVTHGLYVGLPTHHQLIEWLEKNHNILVQKDFISFQIFYKKPIRENFTDINEALIYALNLIK